MTSSLLVTRISRSAYNVPKMGLEDLEGSWVEVSPIGHFRYIWVIRDPVVRYGPFSISSSVWIIEATVQVHSYLRSNAIVFNTERRTQRKATSQKQISNYKQLQFSFVLFENRNRCRR